MPKCRVGAGHCHHAAAGLPGVCPTPEQGPLSTTKPRTCQVAGDEPWKQRDFLSPDPQETDFAVGMSQPALAPEPPWSPHSHRLIL